ncbi:esterase-like activity of phytase family protein [Caldimonas brevitalea]|uniref:Glycerophosphoryl diester phosphodiesterase n=1 Tax=Caldimonas brevitalea TaxID=413882 RepID=A0A0G3BDC6_9BURK|nr:esterase-like activity of phytase family protein [Caldimonas brevitalea]AKJ27389.1 glycerophosphoryl diester phosphodiesterase [Caldimonas brevitalea]
MHPYSLLRPLAAVVTLLCAQAGLAAHPAQPLLTGWAGMPAATFADGPTSGQFATPNTYGTHIPPYLHRQPVQGFSGVLRGPGHNTFRFLTDNGFGGKANSADALLRLYTVKVDFRSRRGGSGRVMPATWHSGRPTWRFDASTRITLNDADHQLGLPIQADHAHYYNDSARPPVDPQIRRDRLLTGADLDVESVRRDRHGHYWFGDEFGPYLVKTDAQGKVLRPAIPLPGVRAPEHAEVVQGNATANIGASGGFEGLAINASGTRLYTLLEKSVAGDPASTLRISEFDLSSEAYTGTVYHYPLDAAGVAIGDMTAIDDTRFIVIERNNGTATTPTPPFKKLYLVDLAGVPHGGVVRKTELVDLMNVPDPDDLDRDGRRVYTMPYVTIEDVLVLNDHTLLVVNDNNFPYGGGREAAADNTEFVRISLPRSLRR